MASEWTRHLAKVQEWGLKKGQKEPDEELLQIIVETNRQVNDCLELSRYFCQINTVCVRTLTTAPQTNAEKSPHSPERRTNINQPLNMPVAVFTAMKDECITTSADIQVSITDMRRGNHVVDKTARDNAIYHRDLLLVKLSRMEAAYANLMECASAHEVDENRDDGIAEITTMVSRAQSEVTIAKAMTDSLLQLEHRRHQAGGSEEQTETANPINDTLDQQPESEATIKSTIKKTTQRHHPVHVRNMRRQRQILRE